jgi:hypothetical protein
VRIDATVESDKQMNSFLQLALQSEGKSKDGGVLSWVAHPGAWRAKVAGVGKNPPTFRRSTFTMSASDQTDLLKLTRDQLRRLCKERGHTGYSKCTKPQLVTLLGSDTRSKFASSASSVAFLPNLDPPSSSSTSKKRPKSGSGTGGSVAKKQKRPNPILPNTPGLQPPASSVPPKTGRNPPVPRDLLVPPVPTAPVTVPLPIQQLLVLPMPLLPPSIAGYSLGLPQPPSQLHPASDLQSHIHEAEKPESKILSAVVDSSRLPFFRDTRTQPMKFLDPRISVRNDHPVPCGPQDSLRTIIVTPSLSVSTEPLPTPYLDFPILPVPAFGLIGMPPSIQDRKRVRSWSIILSGIADADRRACVLVSRMFRYAGKSVLCWRSLGWLTSPL